MLTYKQLNLEAEAETRGERFANMQFFAVGESHRDFSSAPLSPTFSYNELHRSVRLETDHANREVPVTLPVPNLRTSISVPAFSEINCLVPGVSVDTTYCYTYYKIKMLSFSFQCGVYIPLPFEATCHVVSQ